jgi:2-(3-amino-3-carboxypropyl)histidine synthase
VEFGEILNELKNKKIKRIFIQIAEGLKSKAKEIVDFFEKEGFETILSIEPTYGACDIKDEEALRFNCQAIIHIGHSSFGVKSKLPIYFIHYIFDIKEEKIEKFKEEIKKIKYKKIGIVTSLQYVKYANEIEKILKENNFEVFKSKTLEYEAQILGCNVSSAKNVENFVEAFLVITEGKFYPVGLLLNTEKPIFVFDLEKEEIYEISSLREKYRKIIAWNYVKFKEAKEIGLLVSWKKGQMFFDPFKIKKELEKRGKKVYIFVADEIVSEKLIGIDVDCLVNLACPRIFDDIERYKIPFINYIDLIAYENRDNSGKT